MSHRHKAFVSGVNGSEETNKMYHSAAETRPVEQAMAINREGEGEGEGEGVQII